MILAERFEQRIDKPATSRGTFTQGSEQMIDNEMGKEMGRSTSNRRSGFGRGI
ncbi:MAG: hypothetical protein ACRDMA_00320 [Solirubrobacterales bacterium]